jgi:hypothetical protein
LIYQGSALIDGAGAQSSPPDEKKLAPDDLFFSAGRPRTYQIAGGVCPGWGLLAEHPHYHLTYYPK